MFRLYQTMRTYIIQVTTEEEAYSDTDLCDCGDNSDTTVICDYDSVVSMVPPMGQFHEKWNPEVKL